MTGHGRCTTSTTVRKSHSLHNSSAVLSVSSADSQRPSYQSCHDDDDDDDKPTASFISHCSRLFTESAHQHDSVSHLLTCYTIALPARRSGCWIYMLGGPGLQSDRGLPCLFPLPFFFFSLHLSSPPLPCPF